MSTHTKGPWAVKTRESIFHPGMTIEDGVCGPDGEQIKVHGLALTATEEAKANSRLVAASPELLAEVEALYTELADFENDWPGRNTGKGQSRLIRLRTMLAKATGRTEQEVQDDYGTRAARARAGA